MPEPVADRKAMIAGMRPALQPGRYVFCALGDVPLPDEMRDRALGFFREPEGLSVILPLDFAQSKGLDVSGVPMRQITLQVYSSLVGVGLTAAVSAALADAGIACNVIAAALHDHVFVPEDRAAEALAVLESLARSA
jgi:hypothetical protein